MKYFVFSDIHGHYQLLINELKKAGFDINNDNHMLISIGDNFDRGKENIEVYQYLKELKVNVESFRGSERLKVTRDD
jgi:serine/threonine protein phosphatase 1